jgi:hypothetical protein
MYYSIFLTDKGEAIALGFQHYILSLGTAVIIPSLLVPRMGGTDVSKLFQVIYIFFLNAIQYNIVLLLRYK